jgi:hypothetical protein
VVGGCHWKRDGRVKRIEGRVMRLSLGAVDCMRGIELGARGWLRRTGRVCLGRSNMVSGTRKAVVRAANPVRPVPTQNCLTQPSSAAMYPPVMPPTTEPLARDAV